MSILSQGVVQANYEPTTSFKLETVACASQEVKQHHLSYKCVCGMGISYRESSPILGKFLLDFSLQLQLQSTYVQSRQQTSHVSMHLSIHEYPS